MFKARSKRVFKISRVISDDSACSTYNVLFCLTLFYFFKSTKFSKTIRDLHALIHTTYYAQLKAKI